LKSEKLLWTNGRTESSRLTMASLDRLREVGLRINCIKSTKHMAIKCHSQSTLWHPTIDWAGFNVSTNTV